MNTEINKKVENQIPLETMFPFLRKNRLIEEAKKRAEEKKKFVKPKNKVSKDEQIMANTILVMAQLLTDYMDHFMSMDIPFKDLPEHPINQAIKFCEEFGNRTSEFEGVIGTNYMENLGRKVHLVVEQNFKPLSTLEKKVYNDYTGK